MTFENTMQYLLDFVSEECMTKDEAMKYLFLTENNGFYWKDGELVNDWLNEVSIRRPLKNKNKPAEERYDSLSVFDTKDYILKRRFDFYIAKLNQSPEDDTREKLTTMVKKLKDRIFSYPPESSNILINNYPDNIKEDWLNAINEYKTRIDEIVNELNTSFPMGD